MIFFQVRAFPLNYASKINIELLRCHGLETEANSELITAIENLACNIRRLEGRETKYYGSVFINLIRLSQSNFNGLIELAKILSSLRAELWNRFNQDKAALRALLNEMCFSIDGGIFTECIKRITGYGKPVFETSQFYELYYQLTTLLDIIKSKTNYSLYFYSLSLIRNNLIIYHFYCHAKDHKTLVESMDNLQELPEIFNSDRILKSIRENILSISLTSNDVSIKHYVTSGPK